VGVSPFFYGKAQTRPGHKMGHVTVLDESVAALKAKATLVKERIRLMSAY
jgi:5-(carboxyamino)imidazole ribonucleotide synthase